MASHAKTTKSKRGRRDEKLRKRHLRRMRKKTRRLASEGCLQF